MLRHGYSRKDLKILQRILPYQIQGLQEVNVNFDTFSGVLKAYQEKLGEVGGMILNEDIL